MKLTKRSGSTTAASSTPSLETYAYNALGNITGWKTNASATSTYVYGGTVYTNPHAVTDLASTTYAYDNNGNVTSAGSKGYTWDYRNRLSAALALRKENPFALLKKPIYVVQAGASGLSAISGSFSYLFGPASVIATAFRGFSLLFAILSGRIYFNEHHFLLRITLFVVICTGLVLLII